MNSVRLSAALWLAFCAVCAADPLVQLPLGDFACQATGRLQTDNRAAATPQKAGEVSISIVRTGDLRRDTITWNDGRTIEAWSQTKTGLMQVERKRGQTIMDVSRNDPARNSIISPLLTFEPESINWIVKEKQKPVTPVDYNGRPALHYQMTVKIPRLDKVPEVAIWQAWIDPKTHIPLAFDDGFYTYDLTFSTTPPESLTLPDHFKKDLQQYQNANAPLRHL